MSPDQDPPGFASGRMVYRRLLVHAFAYWPILLVSMVGMIFMAASEAGFAALMRPLLDDAFGDGGGPLAQWVPLLLVALFLVRGIAEFAAHYSMRFVGRQIIKRLRAELFDRLLHMPVPRFQHQSSGELISRLTFNVEQVASAATDGFSVLLRDSLTVLILLGWMWYLNGLLTLTILIIAPLVALVVNAVTRRFRALSHGIQKNMSDVTHVVQEAIDGHRVVRIFGGQHYERQRFEIINEANRRLHMHLEGIRSAYTPFIQLLVAMVLAFIIWLATSAHMRTEVSPGTFVSFLTAMMLLLSPIQRLSNVNVTLQRGIAAGQNIFAVLDEAVEPDTGTQALAQVQGAIRFEQVGFHYPGTTHAVLHNLDLDIAAGETVALVGRSGSGKTTLMHLLPRFYTPTQGRILLDGHDLRDLPLKDLRRHMAYVGQEVVLFADTIEANIAYGHPEASAAAIRDAAQQANALEFIERLPEGFATPIGENGVRLSGGQRQRIAIARALLRNAPLLLLDEATSSLDNESERAVQEALQHLMRERTTLVIAHRLSTIEHADRIVVLDAGQVVETGRHADLLAQGGLYHHLYQMQFRESG